MTNQTEGCERMNQSSNKARRRNIANAASGLPDRVHVALYACIHDGRDPKEVMAYVRAQAEARDWVVRAMYYDRAHLTSIRTDRRAWHKVQRLLKTREVSGLVARSEGEIAYSAQGGQWFRDWMLALPAFAVYVGEPSFGSSAGESSSEAVR